MKLVRFSWRSLRRQWRGGELRALAIALVIAVAAITSVGFFTDRVERALSAQAGELIAADLMLQSSTPIAGAWRAEAEQRGLRTAQTLNFASVVLFGEHTRLAAVKAVGPGYPLRGRLKISRAAYATASVTDDIPSVGSAWVDARLLRALHIRLGDKVHVGAASLVVTRVLAYEPDRGGAMFNIAPRLMMNLADVAATKLIQPGSRVHYQLLLAGTADRLQRLRTWLTPRLGPAQQLQNASDARPELRSALDRGQRFLGLASLVSVLLAGVAIAISARRYAARQLDSAALLRCLGARQSWISRLYLLQLSWIGVAAGGAGALLGYVAQFGLAALLAGVVGGSLPTPGLWPALAGVTAGLVTLYGFAWPPLLRLQRVPPARVLRRDLGPVPARAATVYAAALLAIAVLAVWQAGELRLALWFLVGVAATLGLLGLAGALLVRVLAALRQRVGVAWRFGLANIARRSAASTVQLLGFGVGIMALLLLTLIRTDLLAAWKQNLPVDAPNQFAINIQGDQLAALRSFFAAHGRTAPILYPMVRARLTAINGHAVDASSYSSARAKRLVARDFNLSWSAHPQRGNRIVSGHWWGGADQRKNQLSMETGIADALAIHVGDQLTYQIAGRDLQAEVTSLRKVQWDTMRPNFFVVAPPGLLADYPATWISSFYLPSMQRGFLSQLVRAFPNVTIIDVDAVMSQVRSIMDRVSLAVQYVFVFTLVAGLVVLYAAIQATHDERLHEGAILRALGAGRRTLLTGLLSEFITLGMLSGLLAAFGATAIGSVIGAQFLDLTLQVQPLWWLVGMLVGAVGVGLAGVLGARAVLRQSPMQTLRNL